MNSNKSKIYYFQLTARGYELDSYGHVNNAVYLNYAEQGRWELFRELGLLERLMADQTKVVIVENHIKYIRQVKLFDKITVETQMEKSAHFLLFHHHLLNAITGKTVAKVTAKSVFLDEQNKPCDIPEFLLAFLKEE